MGTWSYDPPNNKTRYPPNTIIYHVVAGGQCSSSCYLPVHGIWTTLAIYNSRKQILLPDYRVVSVKLLFQIYCLGTGTGSQGHHPLRPSSPRSSLLFFILDIALSFCWNQGVSSERRNCLKTTALEVCGGVILGGTLTGTSMGILKKHWNCLAFGSASLGLPKIEARQWTCHFNEHSCGSSVVLR